MLHRLIWPIIMMDQNLEFAIEVHHSKDSEFVVDTHIFKREGANLDFFQLPF